MINIEKTAEKYVIISFDGREELADAMDVLLKELPRIGSPVYLTYIPPKTREDLAQIDIYAQKGYVGIMR